MSAATSPRLDAGDLVEVPLARILGALAAESATGVLTVRSDDDIVAISFRAGRIVGADALAETLETGLGKALVGEGLLTEEELGAALEGMRTGDHRLDEALRTSGLLDRRDYLAAVRRYAASLVRAAASWDRGDYRFYPGDDISFEEDLEPIDVAELAFGGTGVGGTVADPPEASSIGTPDEAPRPASVESASVESDPVEPALDADDSLAEVVALVGARRAGSDRVSSAVERERSAAVASPEETIEPPAPESRPAVPEAGRRTRGAPRSGPPSWIAPVLVLALIAAVALLRPNALVYPFFWLESERLEFEHERRASVYQKIDRAAKTFFLLEGRFPDDLPSLVAHGLLAPADIVGPRGRILNYRPGDWGYVIRSPVEDGTDAGVSRTDAIAGNFILDPEFVDRVSADDSVPLILLD